MNKASIETTPIKYSAAAVKVLRFSINPHSRCFHLHWHDRIEIIRVNKGYMVLEGYNNNLKLKEGEMTLFPPKMSHGGHTEDEAVDYDVLMFDLKMFYNQTDVCNHFFPALFDGCAKFESVISDSETVACTDRICNSTEQGSLEIIALVYKLIALLFEKHLSNLSFESNTKIKPIIDYIEENYMFDISTKTLSKAFGYSAEHFCRKFKEDTGITPMTYLRIYRLEQSLKMIKSNENTISEIALKCGFYDANYFTRCFKSYYGVPPKFYKNKP